MFIDLPLTIGQTKRTYWYQWRYAVKWWAPQYSKEELELTGMTRWEDWQLIAIKQLNTSGLVTTLHFIDLSRYKNQWDDQLQAILKGDEWKPQTNEPPALDPNSPYDENGYLK